MTLFARKRGLGTLIYLVIRGFRNGDPTTIGITVAVVLAIVGWMAYSSWSARKRREEAEFAQQLHGPPGRDPSQLP
jgi:hypothetical protein